jgi:hypothetical protein
MSEKKTYISQNFSLSILLFIHLISYIVLIFLVCSSIHQKHHRQTSTGLISLQHTNSILLLSIFYYFLEVMIVGL